MKQVGAPGSIQRYLSSKCRGSWGGRYVVLEYGDNPTRAIVRAIQDTPEAAERYMMPGRYLYDLDSYYGKAATL